MFITIMLTSHIKKKKKKKKNSKCLITFFLDIRLDLILGACSFLVHISAMEYVQYLTAVFF